MSSDSSDDEKLARLREATDPQFITDEMFQKTAKSQSKTEPNQLPSLRKANANDDERFNLFRTTPEFQNHVAKHLTTFLDKTLEERLNYKAKTKHKSKAKYKNRIRLLRTSTDCVIDGYDEPIVQKRTKPQNAESDKIREENCKLVVTDLRAIREEVKHWSTRSKAPVYRYKRKKRGKGKLEEIPNQFKAL